MHSGKAALRQIRRSPRDTRSSQDAFFMFFVSVMLTQFASLWTGRITHQLIKKRLSAVGPKVFPGRSSGDSSRRFHLAASAPDSKLSLGLVTG